jgi:hypothetical protein
MKLILRGWDKERGAYQVVREYPSLSHNFAWFVDEAEAKRFVDLYRYFTDIESCARVPPIRIPHGGRQE